MQRIQKGCRHGGVKPRSGEAIPKEWSCGHGRGLPTRRLSAEGADLHLRRSCMQGRHQDIVCGSPTVQSYGFVGSLAGPEGCGRRYGITEELEYHASGPSPGDRGYVPGSGKLEPWDTPSAFSAPGSSGDGHYNQSAGVVAGMPGCGPIPPLPGHTGERNAPPAGGGRQWPTEAQRCLAGGGVLRQGPCKEATPCEGGRRLGAAQPL